jgi:hypothetical protein
MATDDYHEPGAGVEFTVDVPAPGRSGRRGRIPGGGVMPA